MRKLFIAVVCLLVAALGIGWAALRRIDRQFSPPAQLKENLAAVAAGQVHIYAARVGDHVIFFDTGKHTDGHAVDALLTHMQATRADVRDIFLTQGQAHHIAAAPLFAGARIWAGSNDVELAAGHISPEGWTAKVSAWFFRPPSVVVSHSLEGNVQTAMAQQQFVQAFSLAGPTLGSYAYLWDGVLFVGDAMDFDGSQLVAADTFFAPAPQRTHAAVAQLIDLLAGPGGRHIQIDRVCATHGGCTPAGTGSLQLADYAKRMAPFDSASNTVSPS